jgi:hypothetical protein
MKFTTKIITPEMAKEMLLSNTSANRKLDPAKVKKLAQQMKAGQFLLTHQGIAFDMDGRLLDGQHRLRAIVEAGVPVTMVVAEGSSPESFGVIDQGKPRDAASLLSMMRPGAKDVLRVAAAGRMMMGGLAGRSYDRAEVARFACKHYDLISMFADALGTGGESRSVTGGSPIIAAFANAVLLAGYPLENVYGAARRLGRLEFDGDDDPIKRLFVRLSDERATGRTRRMVARSVRLYAISVSGIRNAIARRRIMRIELSTVDFGDNGMDTAIRRSLLPHAVPQPMAAE